MEQATSVPGGIAMGSSWNSLGACAERWRTYLPAVSCSCAEPSPLMGKRQSLASHHTPSAGVSTLASRGGGGAGGGAHSTVDVRHTPSTSAQHSPEAQISWQRDGSCSYGNVAQSLFSAVQTRGHDAGLGGAGGGIVVSHAARASQSQGRRMSRCCSILPRRTTQLHDGRVWQASRSIATWVVGVVGSLSHNALLG